MTPDTTVSGNRRAYAFYATDDVYAIAVLVFVHRLRELGSDPDIDIVVLHLPLADHLVAWMREMGIQPRLVPPLRYTQRGPYQDSLVKLRILELGDYDRVVYVDADALPLKHLDQLFTLEFDEPIAAPPAYWLPQPFWTTALLVVKPSTALWRRVRRHFEAAARERRYDMDIVNAEFRDEIRTLPAEIVCLNSEWEDVDRPGFFGDPVEAYAKVSVVHFTALGKPWSYPPGMARRLRPNAHPVFYALWDRWWQARDAVFEASEPRRDERSRATAGDPMVWGDMPDTGRRDSFLHALRLLHHITPGGAVIVETGTLRNAASRDSDGWSTLAFAWFAARTRGQLYTVDVDARALEVAREVTKPFGPAVATVECDSVRFLRQWDSTLRGAIDLLYLDSLDWYDRPASERHCLEEARAAMPHLARDALVLIDDTVPAGLDASGLRYEGKGALAIPFLLAQGLRLVATISSQVLLRRPAATMDWDLTLRRVAGVEVTRISAGCLVRQPDRGRLHYLNHTAALVLELCTGAVAAGAIPGLVQDAYGLAEAPTAEVADCLTRLLREGLIH